MVLDEIIYPFLDLNGAIVEVLRMDKYFHPTLNNRCNYLSMLALDLIHVSERVTVSQEVLIDID